MKKTALLFIVILAVILVALIALRLVPRQSSHTSVLRETTLGAQETIPARVRALGRVAPGKQAALSFPSDGLLAEILVEVGEQVQAGQQLARLDSRQAELSIALAEAVLKVNEAHLNQLTTRPTLAEFQAERALEKAVQALREAAEKHTALQSRQLAVAEAELKLTELALRNAQQAYDRVAWRPDIGMLPEALALERATAEHHRAQAHYNLTLATNEYLSALHNAAIQVIQTQLEVQRSQRSLTADEKAIAEGEVEQARLALEQAKLQWTNTILTAPFSGTIVSIEAEVGQVVNLGTPVLLLADLDHCYIEAQVNEKDIGRVQVGQDATISLKAFPDTPLKGKVMSISPLATTVEGEAYYTAKIELLPTDVAILPGMTAMVDIATSVPMIKGVGATPTLPKATPTPDPYQIPREHMVTFDIEQRGVRDPEVLRAMRTVPRHEFVLPNYVNRAYGDHPLPIGYGQTISQPYIVAVMTELLKLKRSDRVLEIGTGSGYQAAILAELTNEVYSVEIIEELYKRATETLNRLGYSHVKTKHADGYYGWEEFAPYDAIIVTCAPDHIPQPLINQLKDGGRLVIPVGPPGGYQTLWLIEKHGDEIVSKEIMGVIFVPLTGTHPSR
ncbi:MAG: protein-L-isoaspartate(D-aspartate) O-methyltransferase [Anaerolineae bacterium]